MHNYKEMLFSIAALKICWSRCGTQMVLKSLKFSEPLHCHYILRLLLPFQLPYLESQHIGTSVGNGPNLVTYNIRTLWCYAAPLFLKLRRHSTVLYHWGSSTTISLKCLAEPNVPCFFKVQISTIRSYVNIHLTLKTWAEDPPKHCFP